MNTPHSTALVFAIALAALPSTHAARADVAGIGTPVARSDGLPFMIEGVWDEKITVKNCVSGGMLATAHGFNMFIRGGTLIATNAAPPTTQGPTFGNWWFDPPGRHYGVAMRFFRFDPATSAFLGWRDVQREIELARDGKSLTGEITFQDFNPTGTQVGAGCASETGTRVLEH